MPLSSIIDTSLKTPGIFLQVSLGVGPQSAGDAPLRILVLGNKTSTGTKANADISQVFSTTDAVTYYGQGSELHRQIRNLLLAYPTATLYAGVIAESGGVAATGTITFAGGPATAAGTIEVYVCEERVVATVASGDNITAIATAVALAINNDPNLPVTATSAVGVVTVTAKHKGPRGNSIRVRDVLTSVTGVTHTPTDAYLTLGATSDSPATVLDAASAQRWNCIVVPYADATNLALVKAHVDTYAGPTENKRGVFVAGTADTLANATTAATTINSARGRYVWHYNSDVPPGELAASYAGRYFSGISTNRARNLDGLTVPSAKPQRTLGDQPIASEIASALNNGITPLKVLADGITVAVVRAITMRSRDTGGLPNYAVLDVSKVDVPDAVADQLETEFGTVFSGFNLAGDTDGEMPPPGVATPKTIQDWAFGITKRFDAEDNEGSAGTYGAYLVNVDENAPNIVVQIDGTAQGRANLSVPLDVVEGFHQLAADVRQIG